MLVKISMMFRLYTEVKLITILKRCFFQKRLFSLNLTVNLINTVNFAVFIKHRKHKLYLITYFNYQQLRKFSCNVNNLHNQT